MAQGERIAVADAWRIVRQLDLAPYELASVGRNNWVFLSAERCISIPRDMAQLRYEIRAAAMRFLARNDIPTTTILDRGTREGIEFIITQRIRADIIDLRTLPTAQQAVIHEQCGDTARRLHALQVPGYGRLTSALEGSHASWRAFVEEFHTSGMQRLQKTKSLWGQFSKRIEQRFAEKEHLLDHPQTGFLHGDYHVKNMLFENTHLRALLDLDIVMSGDVYWDLCHYVRTHSGERRQGATAFRNAYGEWNEEKANFYAMILWTRKLASQGESRPAALQESVPEMERILQWPISSGIHNM
jgi:aminoglycoside phosphotransferase (APT) family kinase protein